MSTPNPAESLTPDAMIARLMAELDTAREEIKRCGTASALLATQALERQKEADRLRDRMILMIDVIATGAALIAAHEAALPEDRMVSLRRAYQRAKLALDPPDEDTHGR